MASVSDIRHKQRAVIEFLVAEKETVGNIHKRLCKVYGTSAVDRSTVGRWARRVAASEGGAAELQDLQRAGRPPMAVTPDMLQRADVVIRADRRITTRQLVLKLSVSKGSVDAIINALGYRKVCARWVPRSLTVDHKSQRKDIASDLLQRFEADGEAFLSQIVTGDETWVHHFEPETKRQSMEWRHVDSPQKKKFKTVPSAGKVMITVFWDSEGPILIDVMPKGGTINSESYVKTLDKLKQRFRRLQRHVNPREVFIQHDNARPHTSLRTSAHIAKLGWTVLPHPPYSPIWPPQISTCLVH